MIALPPQIVHDLHVQRKPLPKYPDQERSRTWPTQVTGLRKPGQRTSPPLLLNDRYPGLPTQEARIPQNDSLRAIHGRSSVSMKSDMSFGILDYYFDQPEREPSDTAIRNFDFGLENVAEVPRLAISIPPTTGDYIDTPSTATTSPSSPKGFFRRTSKKPSPTPRRRRRAGAKLKDQRRASLSICCQGQLEPDFFDQPTLDDPNHSGSDHLYPTKYSFSNSSRSRKDSGTSMTSSQLDLPSRSSRSGATSQNSLRYTSSSARISNSTSSLSHIYNHSQRNLSQLSFGEALAEGDDLKPKSPLARLFSRNKKRGSAVSSPRSPTSTTSSGSQNKFMAAMRRIIPRTSKHDTKIT